MSQLCGRSIPGSLHSSGPELSFKLHTSRGYNGGYDLTYTTTTQGQGCGGEVSEGGSCCRGEEAKKARDDPLLDQRAARAVGGAQGANDL